MSQGAQTHVIQGVILTQESVLRRTVGIVGYAREEYVGGVIPINVRPVILLQGSVDQPVM